MKLLLRPNLICALTVMALLNVQTTVPGQGTAFTYQGQLQNNGVPASGTYNLEFTLYTNSAGSGSSAAGPVTNNAVAVSNGLFTVTMDFGAALWNGQSNWLQIAVETNNAATFTSLLPLQPITPAPYAIYAESGGTATSLAGGTALGSGLADSIATGAGDAFIGGGQDNSIQGNGNYGFIGGGQANSANGYWATVAGGYENIANAFGAAVAGGEDNTANGAYAMVAGGGYNTNSGLDSFIGGGLLNRIPVSASKATIGGGQGNIASGAGAFIGGGGYDGNNNDGNTSAGGASGVCGGLGNVVASGATYAFIGGGYHNSASGNGSFIGGGGYDGSAYDGNNNQGNAAAIGGGLGNVVASVASYAFVGGGQGNTAGGNSTVVGGGVNNTASGSGSFIGGGGFDGSIYDGNNNQGAASAIVEGLGNVIEPEATYAFIGGGYQNTNGNYAATLGGGIFNIASGQGATIGGGAFNAASGSAATVSGGQENTASGNYSMVCGGATNIASGGFSFAAGDQARATNNGAFVWADATGPAFGSASNNTFSVRASGGYRLYSSATAGEWLPAGSGSWDPLSDRNAKNDFAPVNVQTVLASVAALPMTTWSYKTEPGVRHLGPMAQDFHAAFNVGEDDRHIAEVDEGGVALAAIQGLNETIENGKQTTDRQIEELKSENAALQEQVMTLQAQMAGLQRSVAGLAGKSVSSLARNSQSQ